ncbi:universal stress protein [Natrialbaceae archaeon AArc-T1-2]|uniref:universal stress protein n=1 Tax=Natrialbaceae archaeon AArc-T1-2 TaxID=3053904 RepID=UPI00255B1C86|nr:universal stress protein [Natrialbaceae archaeon AArc-T1-2]WIV68477.1 universal stress protein [Natrialbaceae archaeon AArc-T1-2]
MHALVAVDDSEPARAAFELAVSEHPDAEFTALCVISPYDVGYGEAAQFGADAFLEEQQETAEELLEDVREHAAERGVSIATETTVGQPTREIVEYVEEHPIDRVFVGSHGRSGVSRILLGSVAEDVARRAPVPVTIVR